MNMELLGPRTVTVDCDVLQADGGTRTASITGGFVALRVALAKLIESNKISPSVIQSPVAAVSVAVVEGVPLLDVCYEEDSAAEVDMNVVMTGSNELIEVQGTAEGRPFSRSVLDDLLNLAGGGIEMLFATQKSALSGS